MPGSRHHKEGGRAVLGPPARVSWGVPATAARLLALWWACLAPLQWQGLGRKTGNGLPALATALLPSWPRPRNLFHSAGLDPPLLAPGGAVASPYRVAFAQYAAPFPLLLVVLGPCRPWPSSEMGLSVQLAQPEEVSWQLEQVVLGLIGHRWILAW